MSETRTDYVKDLYQRWGARFAAHGGELPLDEWRATIEEWPQVTTEPGGVDYLEVDGGGVPAMWLAPKGAAEDRVVLGLHGGGFATGSMYTHRKLFGHLTKAIGTRALVPDYRRSPEHTHPAPVNDALSVYRWLLDQGIEASHIVFAGDSAGGGLVVTTMLLAREQGLPLQAAGMPLSPWFDFEATGASYDDNDSKDMLLNREFGLRLTAMFLGDTGNPQDPLVSPLHADLAGLPPLYLQASRDEVLVDDSRSFAERAQQARVEVRLDLFPGQQHTFQMAAGRSPKADDAIRRLAEWARPKLGQ
ncbi:MAG TPA: alpha/beta hydrolase [Solirubrobacteraceae bacterium]|nr:alpha/beta hydrolase [Solirubrobacteraceae bacterium]